MKLGGIPIIVDYSWLVLFALFSLVTKSFFEGTYEDYSALFYWGMGGVASLLIFLSVAIHELAQVFLAMKLGIRITSIRLHFFGSICYSAEEPRTGRHELIIASAGWVVSVALCCFSLAVLFYFWLTQQAVLFAGIAACLAVANGALAAFHMIPGFPLDGGRILRAILWDHWGDLVRATRVVSRIGNALGLFFIVFGILQFLVTWSWFPVLLFVTGMLMEQSVLRNYQSILEKRVLAGIQVRQVMTDDFVTVDWLLSVEELVQKYLNKYPLTHFPVVNRGEFIGMVSMDGVKHVARDLWTFKQVRDIMVSIEDMPCIQPTDNASEALEKMASANTGSMPVLENGKLVGIVTRSDFVNRSR